MRNSFIQIYIIVFVPKIMKRTNAGSNPDASSKLGALMHDSRNTIVIIMKLIELLGVLNRL